MPDIVAAGIGLFFLGLWIYCLYDVITSDEAIIRHLPKVVWLIVVLLLSDLGSILWLAFGRPHHWSRRVAQGRTNTTDRSLGPAGAPDLNSPDLDRLSPLVRSREEQARLRVWENQLKRREEELRRKELGLESGGTD